MKNNINIKSLIGMNVLYETYFKTTIADDVEIYSGMTMNLRMAYASLKKKTQPFEEWVADLDQDAVTECVDYVNQRIEELNITPADAVEEIAEDGTKNA